MGPDLEDLLDGDESWDDAEAAETSWRDVLRDTLSDDFEKASDEALDDLLDDAMSSLSAAEGYGFASALNQIGRSAGRVVEDPTFARVAQAALPLAGGTLGTAVGGPVGTTLGTRLGQAAAGTLPGRAAPVSPVRAIAASSAPAALPAPVVSNAAGQALLLANDKTVLQGLLAAALGQYGQRQINGIPVAQLLGMFSEVVGQAAADADELMYLEGGDVESAIDEPPESPQDLYLALVDTENLELAEAFNDHEEEWW